MKAHDIAVGCAYLVKVSGKVVPVIVRHERDEARANGSFPIWICENQRTGRMITVRSSQKFREAIPRATGMSDYARTAAQGGGLR